MRWFLVDKSSTVQPTDGSYSLWKPVIRAEGKNQCVYCAIHEGQFGGLRNFHVEHYRPQKKFPELKNTITNLFYSCGICNSFKGSSWPDEPEKDHSRSAFPCPSEIDYSEIFICNDDTYVLNSDSVAGGFVIERLNLNRPQLIFQRRLAAAYMRIAELSELFNEILKQSDDYSKDELIEVFKCNAAITQLLLEARDLVPYEQKDVGRVKKNSGSIA